MIKQRLKKLAIAGMIMILSIQLAACGQSHKDNTSQIMQPDGEQAIYLAQEVNLPEYDDISAAYSFQNTFYYAAVIYDKAGDSYNSGLYTLQITDGDAVPKRLPVELADGEYIQHLTVDSSGQINLVIYLAEDSGEKVFIKSYQQDGKLLTEYDITEYFAKAEYVYCAAMASDDKGNILFATPNNDIFVLNQTGGLLFEVNAGDYISQLVKVDNDRVLAAYWGNQGIEVREIDFASKGLGKKYTIPTTSTVKLISMQDDAGFLFSTDSAVYYMNGEDGQYSQLFDWNSLNFTMDYNTSLFAAEDGTILFLRKQYSDDSMEAELYTIKPAPEDYVASEKTIITYGELSFFSNTAVREAIIEFNKNQEEYRIEIIEYGSDDLNEGITRLNADIIEGNAPDILSLPPRFSMELYAQKGILEDLYPFIDHDLQLSREDFIPNILKAYENHDKLYAIPIAFSLYTMYGKTSVVGTTPGWTLDEMMTFVQEHPDSQIFDEASKSNVMNICQKTNWTQLIDWENESQPFNRELFIKMLTFANQFTDDQQYQYDGNLEKKISDGQLLLLDTNVSTATSHQIAYALFGEDITYIGYPSETGNGSMVGSVSTMALNAKSEHKEAAWEFLRTLLVSDFHLSNNFSEFSIRKDGLEKQFESAKEAEYGVDEFGNQMEIPQGSAMLTTGDYTFEVDIYAAKEEEINTLRDLIYSVSSLRTSEAQIESIISEESKHFFSGAKTADEVADIVANRVQLYVAEQK